MNRIDACFSRLKEQSKKALITYLVAGDPSLKKTGELVQTLEEAGADLIELGIPFSDPLADGVVNQLGCQRALDSGTTVRGVLDLVRDIRKTSEIPIVFFTYYNPVFHYGLARFLKEAAEAGADGALILDLPPEEAGPEWEDNPDFRRISLISPTTPRTRIESIARHSSGFIYYVSRRGVTGMQQTIAADMEDQLNAIREFTDLPICVGFGVSSPEQASSISQMADGVVVGSALVHRIGEKGNDPSLLSELTEFTSSLATAVHSS
ncbi:MAG: tryptophan synthase subunit alpha [Verrucomicrobiota bacterium]